MTLFEVAALLPEIPVLYDRCLALAVIEAVREPDGRRGCDLTASGAGGLFRMRGLGGTELAVHFSKAGVFISGSNADAGSYRSEEECRELLKSIPEVFRPHLDDHDENRGGSQVVSAVLWRRPEDHAWQAEQFAVPEGCSEKGCFGKDCSELHRALGIFEGLTASSPETIFRSHTEPGRREALSHIFALRPLTDEIVAVLNPKCVRAHLADDIISIGYPRNADVTGVGTAPLIDESTGPRWSAYGTRRWPCSAELCRGIPSGTAPAGGSGRPEA